jgi:CheY-like chemotaxis protein
MAKFGPIVIVEDDFEDEDIFQDVLKDLDVKNKLVWFRHTKDAFDYLKTTNEQPFIIFSDVNLPGQNGIEFKRQIDADHQLRQKSIPFVFYSTSVDRENVTKAYTEMTIQGFFQKKNSFDKIKETLKLVFDYWEICKHPNSDN